LYTPFGGFPESIILLTGIPQKPDVRHSSAETLRGALWRGRDCSDINAEIYPGRRAVDGDHFRDSNCNGIFGVNPETGSVLTHPRHPNLRERTSGIF
jgi:hypothetical protein